VKRAIAIPEIKANIRLQYDSELHQIAVGGTDAANPASGIMSAYTRHGRKIGSLTTPRFDQCNLDVTQHMMACAGDTRITRTQLRANAAPVVVDTTPVDPGVHTAAIDQSTHAVFTVWSKRDGSGDFVQKFAPSAMGS
jgi:hypothetical protein